MTLIKALFFLLIYSIGSQAYAAEIAFFRSYEKNGKPIIYEGEYSHVAIKYKGLWLHAHPYYQIQLLTSLDQFIDSYVILENKNYPEPTDEFVDQQLQMKFDLFSRWDSTTQTYCSKLAGQYLKMTPTEMHFDAHGWRQTHANQHIGQLGLSPSDVYSFAKKHLNFKPKTEASICKAYLGRQEVIFELL